MEGDRVQLDRHGGRTTVLVSVLNFAMVQGAVYDAVNAIDRGHQPYLVQPDGDPTDSKPAAAAAASYRVLIGLSAQQ